MGLCQLEEIRIEKPKTKDAKEILKIVNLYAQKGDLLPLSLAEIYENIRDFFVAKGSKGKIVGVSSLRIVWEDLAEIRSLAVLEEYRGKGIGKTLIKECLKEAKELGIKKIFVLTKKPAYFESFNFKRVDKADLPFKVWMDCLRCPKYPDHCDEVALVLSFTFTN